MHNIKTYQISTKGIEIIKKANTSFNTTVYLATPLFLFINFSIAYRISGQLLGGKFWLIFIIISLTSSFLSIVLPLNAIRKLRRVVMKVENEEGKNTLYTYGKQKIILSNYKTIETDFRLQKHTYAALEIKNSGETYFILKPFYKGYAEIKEDHL